MVNSYVDLIYWFSNSFSLIEKVIKTVRSNKPLHIFSGIFYSNLEKKRNFLTYIPLGNSYKRKLGVGKITNKLNKLNRFFRVDKFGTNFSPPSNQTDIKNYTRICRLIRFIFYKLVQFGLKSL